MLNNSLSFHDLSDGERGAFIGVAEKRMLPVGFSLYKFTGNSPFRTSYQGAVTPWWSSVEPLDPSDPGLVGTLARAQRLNCTPADLARARAAVTLEWNTMTGLERVRLLIPVFAFVGRCRHQLRSNERDPEQGAPIHPNVVFIGGAWQVFIPNLSWTDIAVDH